MYLDRDPGGFTWVWYRGSRLRYRKALCTQDCATADLSEIYELTYWEDVRVIKD